MIGSEKTTLVALERKFLTWIAHILKTIVTAGFKLSVSIRQTSRETRGKIDATPTSGVGVARDRDNAVQNRSFFPSAKSAAIS